MMTNENNDDFNCWGPGDDPPNLLGLQNFWLAGDIYLVATVAMKMTTGWWLNQPI